jgi:hypothetical protein
METTEKIDASETSQNEIKKPSKIWEFIKKHKLNTTLITVILILLAWHYISVLSLKNSFSKEKTTIETTYQIKLDSLNSNRLQLTAKTFSWAIRSELLRENSEQVNQFFNDFVKNDDIVKLQYINAETNEIQISTDKKDEGKSDLKYNNLTSQTISQDSTSFELATPINGLNTKLGVFVMTVENLNK